MRRRRRRWRGASPDRPPAFRGGLLAVSPGCSALDGPLGPGDARDLVAWVEAAARGGAGGILLREPSARPEEVRAAAERAIALGAPVVVHDRCPGGRTIAALLGLTLHLPAGGDPVAGPFAVSTHGEAELDRALAAGAVYATLSPVWAPSSKPADRRPTLGPERFLAAALGRPVLALGGVTPARYAELMGRGAYGAAVLGPLRSNGAREVAAYSDAVSPAESSGSGSETGGSPLSGLSGSNTNSRS
jgi:thiamine-phosphate pyrophosphorylase